MGLSELREPCFVDANIFLFTIWDDDLYGLSCKEFLNQVEAERIKENLNVLEEDPYQGDLALI